MSRWYTIDEANERLPEVAAALRLLRDQRRELIRLRDRYVELTGRAMDETTAPPEARTDPAAAERRTLTGLEEPRLIALRVRGIVDQMGASAARLDRQGIALRDIETGLIDFPALLAGRPIWLCWRLGEPEVIRAWHDHESGFAGRRPLEELG